MRRILLALAALAAISLPLSFTGRAHADELWCFDDPIISVNGNLIDIKTELPLLDLLSMRTTTLTVVIPSNVSGSVVLDDVSAFPMKTTISRTGPTWLGIGSIPVTIKANVAASSNLPVQVVATPVANLLKLQLLGSATSKSGTANTQIRMPMSVGNYWL